MSKFLRFIVNLVLVCAIVVAGGLLIPPFMGVTTYVVDDLDKNTNLPMGSVTYALDRKGEAPKVGDKLLLCEETSQYLYRVAAVDGENYILEDKLSTDGGTRETEMSSLAKKVVFTVPFVGYVSMAMQTREGLIIIALAVVFLIVLFVLSEIWKKDDDGEPETIDEDEEEYLSKRQLKKRRKKAAKLAKKEEKKAAKKAAKKASKEEAKQEKRDKKKNKKAAAEPEVIEETSEAPVVYAQPETVPEAEEAKENPEESGEGEDLFAETRDLFAAEVADMMGMAKPEEVEISAEPEETPEIEMETAEPEVEPEPEVEEEKRLAMPIYTRKELLERAQAAGEEPRVVDDEISGITLLDYSDIL